jgi:hypothetical protein
MALQYAAPVPVDRSGTHMSGYPTAKRANTRYSSNNASASSVITMNDNTTVVEVTATGAAAFFRWVASGDTTASVTGSNYDHLVNLNQTRRFVVPIETLGTTSIVGANIQNGLFNRYAMMSAGPISSIYAAEF